MRLAKMDELLPYTYEEKSAVKLSVAMCTYNGASYLQEQLDSILAQTRPPDELVVCDDRSNDHTREIVEAFASKAPFRVRLSVNEKNLGSTKNFERAIKICEREIIFLSDQDDVWSPEKLERIEAVFSSSPDVGLVFTDAELVDESLRPLGRRIWQCVRFDRHKQRLIKQGRAFDVLMSGDIVTGATMAFRSKFKDLILPIPDDSVQDSWIALVVATVADANLAFIDEPLIKYRQHPKQQLGAKVRLGEKLAAARRTYSFASDIRKLKELQEKLSAKNNVVNNGRDFSKLEEKISHLRARQEMPDARLKRVPSVLKEILKLRYHHYSNGWLSAIKDLLN